MGLRADLDRFREVGEQRRQDLEEFIRYGDLGGSGPDSVRIPIKIVDLPEFAYDQRDAGGVGQAQGGEPEPGQPVDPQPGEGDGEDGDGDEEGDGDEAGEGGGEHGYYEMDPEEFAEALDETLGLDLEPKGKLVVDTTEGDYTERTRAGPYSTLDVDRLFKEGLKRALATGYDETYLEEACRVAGADAGDVFAWVREQGMPVSRAKVERAFEAVPAEERGRWRDFETMDAEVERTPPTQRIRRGDLRELTFRREDERYRHPEVTETRERNVVVVNIRDVSGSMREQKRELVERTFAPLDWYLQGKYDRAEFVYIAHDAEAWEVDRGDFFGIRSGGGTRISSAYELAAEVLEERYPWSEWNRYVFAAGDGENAGGDTERNVVPLMREMAVNRHAYVETRPGDRSRATHASDLEDVFDDDSEVVVARITDREDVTDAIQDILASDAESESGTEEVIADV